MERTSTVKCSQVALHFFAVLSYLFVGTVLFLQFLFSRTFHSGNVLYACGWQRYTTSSNAFSNKMKKTLNVVYLYVRKDLCFTWREATCSTRPRQGVVSYIHKHYANYEHWTCVDRNLEETRDTLVYNDMLLHLSSTQTEIKMATDGPQVILQELCLLYGLCVRRVIQK